VRSLTVIEPEVAAQPGDCGRGAGIVVEVDILVFHRAPQAFDEDVVQGAAATVHADLDGAVEQRAGELRTGELRTLVCIKAFRLPAAGQPPLEGRYAEPQVHCRRHLPSDDVAAKPADDRHQIDEATLHRHVGDIRAPDLIGPDDLYSAQ